MVRKIWDLRSVGPHKRWRSIGSIGLMGVIATALTFGLFQNCGPSSSGRLYLTPEEKLIQAASTMPLAYDVTADQIAYMSCAVPRPDEASWETYFTFRVGAYNEGSGISLNAQGRQFLSRNAKNATERAQLLSYSPINANIVAQLDIRQRSQLMSSSIQSVLGGRHRTYDFLLDVLSVSWIVDALVTTPPGTFIRERENPYSKEVLKADARLMLYVDDLTMASFRESFNGPTGNVLTLMFVEADNNGNGRPMVQPGLPTEASGPVAYGRGFRPSFRRPAGADDILGTRVMEGIQEETLEYQSQVLAASKTWSCDPANQFVIVRPSDRTTLSVDRPLNIRVPGGSLKTGVRIRNEDNDGGADSRPRFNRIKAMMPGWYVNMAERVVSPISGSLGDCYRSPTVTYDIANSVCDANSPTGTNERIDCAHLVSFCFRNP